MVVRQRCTGEIHHAVPQRTNGAPTAAAAAAAATRPIESAATIPGPRCSPHCHTSAMASSEDLSTQILNSPELKQKLLGELVPIIYEGLQAAG